MLYLLSEAVLLPGSIASFIGWVDQVATMWHRMVHVPAFASQHINGTADVNDVAAEETWHVLQLGQ